MLVLLALFLAGSVAAMVTNRTIDDQTGDAVTGLRPVYSGSWNYGPMCTGCLVHPNASDAYGGSWHDTTAGFSPAGVANHPTVTLSFTGTAIYVFGIIPNLVPDAATTVNLGFSLDGDPAGTYLHVPDLGTAAFQYNVSMFARNGLSNTAHTIVIEPLVWTRHNYNSILLFDYAVYTIDDSLPPTAGNTSITSSSSSPLGTPTGQTPSSGSSLGSTHSTGAIVGGIIGGVLAALLTLLGIYLVARHRRKQEQPSVIPFTDTVPMHTNPGAKGGVPGPGPSPAHNTVLYSTVPTTATRGHGHGHSAPAPASGHAFAPPTIVSIDPFSDSSVVSPLSPTLSSVTESEIPQQPSMRPLPHPPGAKRGSTPAAGPPENLSDWGYGVGLP